MNGNFLNPEEVYDHENSNWTEVTWFESDFIIKLL